MSTSPPPMPTLVAMCNGLPSRTPLFPLSILLANTIPYAVWFHLLIQTPLQIILVQINALFCFNP